MELSAATKSWINEIFEEHQIHLKEYNLDKPWGGYYVVSEATLPNFIDAFFPELADDLNPDQPWSPKILFVAPFKRLSWQYHHRRSEIWRVIHGKVGVVRSPDDQQRDQEVLLLNDKIELKQGERHRLVGLDQWGIVAEIWQHSDPEDLSNEEDIVRLEDDYGR